MTAAEEAYIKAKTALQANVNSAPAQKEANLKENAWSKEITELVKVQFSAQEKAEDPQNVLLL